jgi:hypothetical protein
MSEQNTPLNPADSTYLIKCVKSGNTGEVYYTFLHDREFWGQIGIAAEFDDLSMAVTKLEAIASGEADEGVFISLREQLDTDVAALYVIRKSDGAIMETRSYWGEDAKTPEKSKDSEAFLLMVQRPNEDDLYINVSEDADIDVTVNIEEATRYGSMNLVRQIIQQIQTASIGEVGEHDGEADPENSESDGWAHLKLMLVKKPADYTAGVIVDEEGKPENNLQAHTEIQLRIYDVTRDEVVETHMLRTVVMIEGAHHFAIRIIREPLQDLWINAQGGADEDFTRDESFIANESEARAFINGFHQLDEHAVLPDLPLEASEEDRLSHRVLKNQLALKARLMQHDRVWLELIDVDRQEVVQSIWLNRPFYDEPVKL